MLLRRGALYLRRRNRPPPTGLVVVPSWAVEAKGPFSSAYEYLVGGNSPLVLLPMRGWCLVESVNDELLVEVGVYAGAGKFNFNASVWAIRLTACFVHRGTRRGWVRLGCERRGRERATARGGEAVRARGAVRERVLRGGVEEKGEGEGGNPLYF